MLNACQIISNNLIFVVGFSVVYIYFLALGAKSTVFDIFFETILSLIDVRRVEFLW